MLCAASGYSLNSTFSRSTEAYVIFPLSSPPPIPSHHTSQHDIYFYNSTQLPGLFLCISVLAPLLPLVPPGWMLDSEDRESDLRASKGRNCCFCPDRELERPRRDGGYFREVGKTHHCGVEAGGVGGGKQRGAGFSYFTVHTYHLGSC